MLHVVTTLSGPYQGRSPVAFRKAYQIWFKPSSGPNGLVSAAHNKRTAGSVWSVWPCCPSGGRDLGEGAVVLVVQVAARLVGVGGPAQHSVPPGSPARATPSTGTGRQAITQ